MTFIHQQDQKKFLEINEVMNTQNLIKFQIIIIEMINLRRISSISACLMHANSVAAENQVNWLNRHSQVPLNSLINRIYFFNQAKTHAQSSIYRSLTIKSMHSLSAHKELGQANADQLKKLNEEADFYCSVNDYDQARKVLRLLTELFLKNGQKGLEYAKTLQKIGDCYKFQGKMTDALDYYERAVKVLDDLEGNLEAQKTLIQLQIGEILYLQQSYDQAERCLLECAQILKKTAHRLELCRALYFLGLINQQKQQYEDAIRFFATQLIILRQSFQLQGLYAKMSIYAFVELAKCYSHSGKFEQALVSCLQAKRLYESEGLQKSNEYAVNLINLAYIHRSLSQIQQFFDYNEKALTILQQILEKDNPGLLSLLLKLGLQYFGAEKPDQALHHMQRYLSIQESHPSEQKDPHLPNALLAVATIHSYKDNCTEALKYYQKSLDIQANDGPLENVATILKQMSEAYFRLRDFTSSLDCAFRCLATYKKLYGEKSPKNAEILSLIAIIYQRIGKQAESLTFIQLAQFVLNDQIKTENK